MLRWIEHDKFYNYGAWASPLSRSHVAPICMIGCAYFVRRNRHMEQYLSKTEGFFFTLKDTVSRHPGFRYTSTTKISLYKTLKNSVTHIRSYIHLD